MSFVDGGREFLFAFRLYIHSRSVIAPIRRGLWPIGPCITVVSVDLRAIAFATSYTMMTLFLSISCIISTVARGNAPRQPSTTTGTATLPAPALPSLYLIFALQQRAGAPRESRHEQTPLPY